MIVAVPGHDLGRRLGEVDGRLQAVDHPLERSAVGAIDVRVADGAEVVAHHQDVLPGEEHHRVAVGVRDRNRDQLDLLAVHVDGRLATCRSRPAGPAAGADGGVVPLAAGAGLHEPRAQLRPRQDDDAQLAEILVAAGVIAVDVGIDEELDRRR